MSKCDIRSQFECQKAFRMSKYDIRPESNDKIGIRMSKSDIRPEFECQNRISNVKMRYSAPVRMSK